MRLCLDVRRENPGGHTPSAALQAGSFRQSRAVRSPLTLLLAPLALALLGAATPAHADTYTLTVGSVSGLYGDIVAIPIHVTRTNSSGVTSPLANAPITLGFFDNAGDPNMEPGSPFNLTTDANGNVAYIMVLDYTLAPNVNITAEASYFAPDGSVPFGDGNVFINLAGQPAVNSQTQDMVFTFQTPDHINSASRLQSMWDANTNAGFQANYFFGGGWPTKNVSASGFTNPTLPEVGFDVAGKHIVLIPAISLGETGGSATAFTKGGQNGISLSATATSGDVSLSYPIALHIQTPKYINKGQAFNVHVTYNADYTGTMQTHSPQANAIVTLQMQAQFYARAQAKLFGATLFDNTLFDFTDHRDRDSPTYDPNATINDDHSINVSRDLVNVLQVLNTAQKSVATITYPDPVTPIVSANLNIPIINAAGSPGSALNYANGGGGSGTHTSTYYEYTDFITVPDEVKNNPNASYARAYDDIVQITGDISNAIALSLDEAGIPFPPLKYTSATPPVAFEAGILDLYTQLGIGFLQEFSFVPHPMVYFADDSNPNVAPIAVEVDPVHGADFAFTMPANGHLGLTPHVAFNNAFTNNTYLAFKGGLYFVPFHLSVGPKKSGDSKEQSVALFDITPFPQIGIANTLPVKVFNKTFTIPFADQDGQKIGLIASDLPLARIRSAYPPFSVYHQDIATGVTHADVTFYADTVQNPDGTRAAPFAGTPTGSGIKYTSRLYDYDPSFPSIQQSEMFNQLLLPNGDPTYAYGGALYAFKTTYYPTPGVHTVYADSSATSRSGNVTQSFGPLRTSLQYPISYPLAHIDTLGTFTSDSSHTYQPLTLVGQGANGPLYGSIVAGSPGFLLAATDNSTPRNTGDFSLLKLADKTLPHSYFGINPYANPKVWGSVPASLLAKAGDYPVVITNPTAQNGGGDSNKVFLHVVNPAAQITSVEFSLADPNRPGKQVVVPSLTAGGPDATLILHGQNFTPDAAVTLTPEASPASTPQSLTYTFVNAGTLKAALPAATYGTPGKYDIAASNPVTDAGANDGGGSATAFSVHNPTPTITQLDKGYANAPSFENFPINSSDVALIVHGINYQGGDPTRSLDATQIVIKGQTVSSQVQDANNLVIIVPATALTTLGDVPMHLVNHSGQTGESVVSQDFFLHVILPAPAILPPPSTRLPLNPPAQLVGQMGTSVTITGANFFSTSTVTMGGVACPTTYVDGTHLRVTVPDAIATTAGLYDVVVTTPKSRDFGPNASDGGASNAYSYNVSANALRPQIKADVQMTKLADGRFQVRMTIMNVGYADVQGVRVMSATLNGVAPAFLSPVTFPLQVNATRTFTLNYPASVGVSGSNAVFAVSGKTIDSGFSSTQRVKLP